MFYKHWKKIALTMTALFWASCDDSPSSADVTNSSSSEEVKSSSSEQATISSSSEQTKTSSSSEEVKSSSSDEFFGAPLYGDIPIFEGSSSSIAEESSSSLEYSETPLYGVITCTPMDSSVAYFAEDYSVEIKKMWKEEEAKHAAVDKIDSIKQTLAETPKCLEDLRTELDRFVALYGAPTIIKNAVFSCDDGTIRPSEEYKKFLKMKEEWEANKPALDKELQKVYEDKMKEIEQQINKCRGKDV